MERGFKYRIYPNASQRDQIARTLGCCRFVYNRALDVKKTAYSETGKSIAANDLIKMIPTWKRDPETSWLAQADSMAPIRTSSDACARAGSRASQSSSRAGTPGSPTAPTAARSSTATISRCRNSEMSGPRYHDLSRDASCRSRSPWTRSAVTSPPSSALTCRPRTR